MTHAKGLMVLLLAVLLAAGCAGSELQKRKDNSWSHVPQSVPETTSWYTYPKPLDVFKRDVNATVPPAYDTNPSGYGHVFRLFAFAGHPFGVAMDYALVRPFYMLAGLAPEWFGLFPEDSYRFYQHHPELTISRDAPQRFP